MKKLATLDNDFDQVGGLLIYKPTGYELWDLLRVGCHASNISRALQKGTASS